MSADLSGAALWQRGCERLAAELPEQQFNTWIRPLPPRRSPSRTRTATRPSWCRSAFPTDSSWTGSAASTPAGSRPS
ncbi:DnaA N-terminal domain-containing protein [Roseateles chitinivorans]|uniref:DnaA N-terminal domain-containing protein n=1 Tax=Roseateles chitinivorans TaxID=2917965 RepID=UPI003D6700C5